MAERRVTVKVDVVGSAGGLKATLATAEKGAAGLQQQIDKINRTVIAPTVKMPSVAAFKVPAIPAAAIAGINSITQAVSDLHAEIARLNQTTIKTPAVGSGVAGGIGSVLAGVVAGRISGGAGGLGPRSVLPGFRGPRSQRYQEFMETVPESDKEFVDAYWRFKKGLKPEKTPAPAAGGGMPAEALPMTPPVSAPPASVPMPAAALVTTPTKTKKPRKTPKVVPPAKPAPLTATDIAAIITTPGMDIAAQVAGIADALKDDLVAGAKLAGLVLPAAAKRNKAGIIEAIKTHMGGLPGTSVPSFVAPWPAIPEPPPRRAPSPGEAAWTSAIPPRGVTPAPGMSGSAAWTSAVPPGFIGPHEFIGPTWPRPRGRDPLVGMSGMAEPMRLPMVGPQAVGAPTRADEKPLGWLATIKNKLIDRYGAKQTAAIIASGQAVGWGMTAVGSAMTHLPVWIPGSTLWGMAPGIGVAEIAKRLRERKAAAAAAGVKTTPHQAISGTEYRGDWPGGGGPGDHMPSRWDRFQSFAGHARMGAAVGAGAMYAGVAALPPVQSQLHNSFQLLAGEIGISVIPEVVRLSGWLQTFARVVRTVNEATGGGLGKALFWGTAALTGIAAVNTGLNMTRNAATGIGWAGRGLGIFADVAAPAAGHAVGAGVSRAVAPAAGGGAGGAVGQAGMGAGGTVAGGGLLATGMNIGGPIAAAIPWIATLAETGSHYASIMTDAQRREEMSTLLLQGPEHVARLRGAPESVMQGHREYARAFAADPTMIMAGLEAARFNATQADERYQIQHGGLTGWLGRQWHGEPGSAPGAANARLMMDPQAQLGGDVTALYDRILMNIAGQPGPLGEQQARSAEAVIQNTSALQANTDAIRGASRSQEI